MSRLYYIDEFTTLDSARYEITYKVEKVPDTTKPNDKLTDIQKLLIGKEISKTYSYLLFQNDSICTILEKKDVDFPAPPSGAGTDEIYRNLLTGNIKVKERVDGTIFCYEENKPELNWTIHNNRKVIANYSCQNATVVFRGRHYEAWFTKEIPISAGPYKFGGLPGLILEIQDSKQNYTFKCVGLKKLKSTKPIKSQNFPCTQTTREELHKFLKKKYKNPTQYFNSMGVMYAVKIDGKVIFNPKDYSLPYNPIELE
jgi:GLPGLI family protein